MKETVRVLRPGGSATFVVADATLFGIPVALGDVLHKLATDVGLEGTEHELPAGQRYLPRQGTAARAASPAGCATRSASDTWPRSRPRVVALLRPARKGGVTSDKQEEVIVNGEESKDIRAGGEGRFEGAT